MALVSPGVEVTIIDQSQYLPAPQNSVPLVVLATAQNKANAAGDGVATATTAANANKLYLVTSQRDLVNLYGTPFFYTTTNGTPIQGYELNEYGLLAAYSLLGVTNRAYILRADIDLASLVGQTGRPVGTPANDTYWLDSAQSTWGIYEFNKTTGQFTNKLPYVVTETSELSGGEPLQSIGNIGDYLVVALDNQYEDPVTGLKTYYYKNSDNLWVAVGSTDWKQSWPTLQGSNSNPAIPLGSVTFNWNGNYNFTVAVNNAGSGTGTVAQFASDFNAKGYGFIEAAVVNGKITFYMYTEQENNYLQVVSASSGILSSLGISAGSYYQPTVNWGTAAQMPLWTTGQPSPRPTGSVWIKVGSAGTGLLPVISAYSSALASWRSKTVNEYTSGWAATAALDSTGGQTIPAGTVYCEYNYDYSYYNGTDLTTDPTPSLYYFYRSNTGSTVVTGSETSPTAGVSGSIYVKVSQPGTSALTAIQEVILNSGDGAEEFVLAWQSANIPYTSCEVASDGAVTLIHTEGGIIILNDHSYVDGSDTGLLEDFGFIPETTTGVLTGPSVVFLFTGIPCTGGTG